MSEVFTEAVPVPAGELAAFGLAMERAREALAVLGAAKAEWLCEPCKTIRPWQSGDFISVPCPGCGTPMTPTSASARALQQARAEVAELRAELECLKGLSRPLKHTAPYIRAAEREQVAAEIEAEAATHLHSIRRGMRWAAWVARGKPADSDPGNDHKLSGALLHGEAERTSTPCCPVETAAVTAERERIRTAIDGLKVTLFRPGNGPAHTQALDVVPLADLLGLLGGQS